MNEAARKRFSVFPARLFSRGWHTLFLLCAMPAVPFSSNSTVCHGQSLPDVIWDHTFGESGMEKSFDVLLTRDGGFLLLGSVDHDKNKQHDIRIVRTDANGLHLWERTLGDLEGGQDDTGVSVQHTKQGDFVILGTTASHGAGKKDFWLIKIPDADTETILWETSFGGTEDDAAHCLRGTSDGGWVLVGETKSYGAGKKDFWLIKTDANGMEQWNRTFGTKKGGEIGYCVQETSDHGFILTGEGAPIVSRKKDVWLIRTDEEGHELWRRGFGGPKADSGRWVEETADGGLILCAQTQSFGAGNKDTWLIKTDAGGVMQWDRTLGGEKHDIPKRVKALAGGEYLLLCETKSFGAGNKDLWAVKTDPYGNPVLEKTFGGKGMDLAGAVVETGDGGFAFSGSTKSFGAGHYDFWLIRTDRDFGDGETAASRTWFCLGRDCSPAPLLDKDGSPILPQEVESAYGKRYAVLVDHEDVTSKAYHDRHGFSLKPRYVDLGDDDWQHIPIDPDVMAVDPVNGRFRFSAGIPPAMEDGDVYGTLKRAAQVRGNMYTPNQFTLADDVLYVSMNESYNHIEVWDVEDWTHPVRWGSMGGVPPYVADVAAANVDGIPYAYYGSGQGIAIATAEPYMGDRGTRIAQASGIQTFTLDMAADASLSGLQIDWPHVQPTVHENFPVIKSFWPEGEAVHPPSSPMDVELAGDLLFASPGGRTSGTLMIFHIMDPENPELIGQLPELPAKIGIETIDMTRGRVYASSAALGLVILNIEDPSAPELISTFNTFDNNTPDDPTDDIMLRVIGGPDRHRRFVPMTWRYQEKAKKDKNVYLVDIQDERFPRVAGIYQTPEGDKPNYTRGHVFASEAKILIADQKIGGGGQLNHKQAFDIITLDMDTTDPRHVVLTEAAHYTTPHLSFFGTWTIDEQNNQLYVLDRSFGVWRYDISDLNMPRKTGGVPIFGEANFGYKKNDTFYYDNTMSGAVIAVDVSDPLSPTPKGAVWDGDATYRKPFFGTGDLLFWKMRGGIKIVDVRVPHQPRVRLRFTEESLLAQHPDLLATLHARHVYLDKLVAIFCHPMGRHLYALCRYREKAKDPWELNAVQLAIEEDAEVPLRFVTSWLAASPEARKRWYGLVENAGRLFITDPTLKELTIWDLGDTQAPLARLDLAASGWASLDPDNPYKTKGKWFAPQVIGDRFYCSTDLFAALIFDIRDARRPAHLGGIQIMETVKDKQGETVVKYRNFEQYMVKGSYLYGKRYGESVKVWDVADPTNITLIADKEKPSETYGGGVFVTSSFSLGAIEGPYIFSPRLEFTTILEVPRTSQGLQDGQIFSVAVY